MMETVARSQFADVHGQAVEVQAENTPSQEEWARALAWHQAHQEEIEGHTACYEDEENSEDEENLAGVYV
ncbi:hypothetical protein CYMTET_10961 [Cymbomonas tetramitiformis]|uniref:Uncharacterized protein n=1 Tax=Cymbomonas tetramitiformis TaxID=36881 RepID=A0AAE0LDM7_9CHLO|nr:hypothetical protein CYMTET_10961 [Cymbomonas tetramitiformis]